MLLEISHLRSPFLSQCPSFVAGNGTAPWLSAGSTSQMPSTHPYHSSISVFIIREAYFPPERFSYCKIICEPNRWFCWASTLRLMDFLAVSPSIFPVTFCPTHTCATVIWPGWASGWRRPGWWAATPAARNPPSWKRSPSRMWPLRTSPVTVSLSFVLCGFTCACLCLAAFWAL